MKKHKVKLGDDAERKDCWRAIYKKKKIDMPDARDMDTAIRLSQKFFKLNSTQGLEVFKLKDDYGDDIPYKKSTAKHDDNHFLGKR